MWEQVTSDGKVDAKLFTEDAEGAATGTVFATTETLQQLGVLECWCVFSAAASAIFWACTTALGNGRPKSVRLRILYEASS